MNDERNILSFKAADTYFQNMARLISSFSEEFYENLNKTIKTLETRDESLLKVINNDVIMKESIYTDENEIITIEVSKVDGENEIITIDGEELLQIPLKYQDKVLNQDKIYFQIWEYTDTGGYDYMDNS